MNADRHQVLVIGGGNAGLSVAGRLRRYGVRDIAVIEPRLEHRYQPAFSHVAGGTVRPEAVVRPQAQVTPRGVTWIRDAAVAAHPDEHRVELASGTSVMYEHLIVCPGIQHDWHDVPGLAAAMGTEAGVSNYEWELALRANDRLRRLKSGRVIFTQPDGPASCAGAAQKPMYLACDYWRATGVLDDIDVVLVTPYPTVYGIPEIDAELMRKIAEYGIELRCGSDLLAVDPERRTVSIGPSAADPAGGPTGGSAETLSYDVLHVVPRQSAPDWLKRSPLAHPADPGGFVDVDPRTLRHLRYPDVWALGDAAATTNSKSGGALRKQTAVLAENLRAVLQGESPKARYNGYSVCPFTVSRSTVVFAEFDDQYRLTPTVPFWRTLYRERRLAWVFDRYVLPWVYWHLILQGRA